MNVGSSCFINAALQTTFSVAPWQRLLQQPANRVASELAAAWQLLERGETMKPVTLLEQWCHNVQEDSAEFFQRLTDTAGLSTSTAGSEQFVLHCQDCDHEVPQGRATAFTDMQVEFVSGGRTLQDLVDNYLRAVPAPEDLQFNGSKWRCPCCQTTRMPKRQARVLEPPAALVVGLKRWHTWMAAGQFLQRKQMYWVGASELLNVQGHIYELAAAVYHVGSMPDAGHYFAVVRGNSPGRLWLCDDAQISEVAAEAQ